MTKAELLKLLEPFPDDIEVVVGSLFDANNLNPAQSAELSEAWEIPKRFGLQDKYSNHKNWAGPPETPIEVLELS